MDKKTDKVKKVKKVKKPKKKITKTSHLHPHELSKEDAEEGEWTCDNCDEGKGDARFRCDDCDFDLCPACVELREPSDGPCATSYHEHPLGVQPAQGWLTSFAVSFQCDHCQKKIDYKEKHYRCNEANPCDFDLCSACWVLEVGPDGPLDPSKTFKAPEAKQEPAAPSGWFSWWGGGSKKEEAPDSEDPESDKDAPKNPPAQLPNGPDFWTLHKGRDEKTFMKLRRLPEMTSADIASAVRARFGIPATDLLVFIDQEDGCDVAISPAMPTLPKYSVYSTNPQGGKSHVPLP